MKRLIMVSMMFISGLVYADAEAVPPAPATTQSSDTTSKNSEAFISIANVHHINLDTTEVDGGGNWLNKRIWYERSQAVFDEIRASVNTATDLRIQFSTEVHTVVEKIVSFWEVVDFTKGQLDSKFKEILIMLDTEQRIMGDLSVEERNLQVAIKQQLPLIDQIGKDIKSIHDIDDKIDDTLKQALKTIDECRDYETKAWDSFKAIAKELDDKKARNLYYQMNNYKQNIDQKSNYLKSTLLPYLHNVLVAKVEMNISKINAAMESLKAKGVDLEKIMSTTQENDSTQIHEREKTAAELAVKKAVEEEKAKADKAAQEHAQALEKAHQKSFSNVMRGYYDATIGKIVNFVHQGFVGSAIDGVSKYSYPIATYVYNTAGSVAAYIYDSAHGITHILSSTSAKKSKVEDKKIETSSIKKDSQDAIQKPAVTIAPSQDKKDSTPAVGDQTSAAVIQSTAPIISAPVITAPIVTEAPVSSAPVIIASTEPEKAEVAIQSFKKEDDKPSETHTIYNVLATVFDFVGTVITSLYNCILQFFKLLMSFSAYIMSGN